MREMGFNDYHKGELTQLLDIARHAIEEHFSPLLPQQPKPFFYHKKLQQPTGCGIRLSVNKKLVGESIQPHPRDSLIMAIYNGAKRSAYQDHRFMPLHQELLSTLDIELLIIHPMQPLDFSSEIELITHLEHHNQGLWIKEGSQEGYVLPNLTSQTQTPLTRIQQLKAKAGLTKQHWSTTQKLCGFMTSTIQGKLRL